MVQEEEEEEEEDGKGEQFYLEIPAETRRNSLGMGFFFAKRIQT